MHLVIIKPDTVGVIRCLKRPIAKQFLILHSSAYIVCMVLPKREWAKIYLLTFKLLANKSRWYVDSFRWVDEFARVNMLVCISPLCLIVRHLATPNEFTIPLDEIFKCLFPL